MARPADPRRTHRVAVLVRPGVLPMELGLVHQLFRAARSSRRVPLYEVTSFALEPGPVPTDADFAVHVENGPAVLDDADTVVVPASHLLDETDDVLPPALRDALARIRPGTRIASICTGAFVLAAAGLLDGHRATTHWHSAERFRRAFPAVEVDPNVLYTDNGEVLTSAGEAAGIDLCLHLIRRDHGAAVANEVARSMVVPPHREGGQAQYLQLPVPEPGARDSTARAREWALKNLHRPLSLSELAAREAMSTRTFTRRFRQEVGTSPLRWLTQQRVERARQLLERTDLPVDRVAEAVGFTSAVSLRQHLATTLGVSPSAYRQTFGGDRHIVPG
ncbi:helix-turn-helix domain-containing protein [Saccharomonospora xinjiangensis]|uniref:GlxA family transcriptional regulator n=1 Tax=Saccharomonospora xinjiangensis TaxID=75294 RepID=UPI0010701AAB|nr:helix-turn-helix domain-containing protein [Saccharomonospora xinjiangensis]QBQ60003.1 HTH-type transcriptional regulator CdhR [Saccharomonospora xinjiangensis]